MKLFVRLLFLILLSFFMTSCAVLIPYGFERPKKDIREIIVGKSTRDDVKRVFGKPNLFKEKEFYTYHKKELPFFITVVFPGAGIAGLGAKDEYIIVIGFDENGIVNHLDFNNADSKIPLSLNKEFTDYLTILEDDNILAFTGGSIVNNDLLFVNARRSKNDDLILIYGLNDNNITKKAKIELHKNKEDKFFSFERQIKEKTSISPDSTLIAVKRKIIKSPRLYDIKDIENIEDLGEIESINDAHLQQIEAKLYFISNKKVLLDITCDKLKQLPTLDKKKIFIMDNRDYTIENHWDDYIFGFFMWPYFPLLSQEDKCLIIGDIDYKHNKSLNINTDQIIAFEEDMWFRNKIYEGFALSDRFIAVRSTMKLSLFDWQKNRHLATIDSLKPTPLDFHISSKNKKLVAKEDDGFIVYSLPNLKKLTEVNNRKDDFNWRSFAAEFSDDGTYFVWSTQGYIEVWKKDVGLDTSSEKKWPYKLVSVLPKITNDPLAPKEQYYSQLIFSKDLKYLINFDIYVYIWDLESGELISILENKYRRKMEKNIDSVSLTQDNELIITGRSKKGDNDKYKVWRIPIEKLKER